MKAVRFDNREAWLNWRLGKVTGSALKDVVNMRDGATKTGIYRAAAQSIIGSAAIAEDDLTAMQAMERGIRLEPEALERFTRETGKKVDNSLIGWERDDDMRMAVSPDGVIGKTQAAEVKCLLSPKHLEALYTQSIPKNTGGYWEQLLQYFIVNEKLQRLYYIFYHPDFPAPLDFFYITITRKELKDDIEKYLEAEREAVGKIREIVNAVSLYTPEDIEKINAVKEELVSDAVHSHMADMERLSRVNSGV